MTLFEYECKVEELLDNALNDLTPKDFDNLLAYTLREYEEFFAIQKRACGNAIKAWNRRITDEQGD